MTQVYPEEIWFMNEDGHQFFISRLKICHKIGIYFTMEGGVP
ncbi:hypothetical protein R1A30_06695 [Paenibacillus larvae]|nr:hypothetical protein [Paenibacillus larvae]